MNKQIVGVTFPVPGPLLSRILDEEKTVFIKPSTLQVKPGMKLVFYASREDQGWHGEAEIESVEHFTNVKEIIKKYKNELFLTPEELEKYEKERQKWQSRGKRPRPWMVIKLKNIKKYPKPIKPPKFVTVSGRYVKEDEYKEILTKTGS